jgi:hypothetical protein
MLKKTVITLPLLLCASLANAGIVTNDTGLLSSAGHQQLSIWLGEDVDLTRLFAKGTNGYNSADWHNAVNNQGRTITLMEVLSGSERRIVGGYNKYSWNSSNTWVYSGDSDNFLFNLTSVLSYQKNTNANNSNQVFNYSNKSIAFGGGHDLVVEDDLIQGSSNLGVSYGDRSRLGQSGYVEEFTGIEGAWTIGQYETFSISASTDVFGAGAVATIDEQGNDTPLPSVVSAPLTVVSLALLGALGFRRRQK